MELLSLLRRWAACAMAVGLMLAMAGGVASAAQPARDMAREARIEQELQAINPALVESFRRGREAMDNDQHAQAAAFFGDVQAAAPTFDPAIRRLGSSVIALGRRAEGLALCEKAVALKRSIENLSTLAFNLAFPRSGQAAPEERARALVLLNECRSLPGGEDLDILSMTAQLALQLQKLDVAREVVAVLRAKHPGQGITHYLSAIVHTLDEEWIRADRAARQASALGFSPDSVQRLLDSGVRTRAVAWWTAWVAGGVVALWVVGLLALFVLGFVLSRAVLRHAEKVNPSLSISPTEQRLRRVYRSLINVAGVYYYVSLPVVMTIVIGVTAAIFYAFFAIGWLPIKLLVILGVIAIATIYTMVRSLFIKVSSEEPGRPLRRDEAEGLWKLAEEVARALGTRAIDEIRITPGTELAVYERGTWREKLQNRARRILILGTGVLPGFKQNDFRSVLAHEYGHFSNRDTAGGDIALRVRNDMMKFYVAMCAAGQATHANVAFHFLRVYHFIFRRVSHGATRLQEILADRFAARAYGADALEGGLRHVIRRSIEFHALAEREIKAGIEARRPLENLYAARTAETADTEAEFQKVMSQETTDDDTHPSPADRIRLIASLKLPIWEARTGEVWALFNSPEAVAREMMAQVEKDVAQHREKGDDTAERAAVAAVG